jgi:hypothetical protein
MILREENRRTRRKTCLSVTLPTANHTWTDLAVNQGNGGERPATNRLSRGTAIAYAVSGRVLIAEAHVGSQFSPCGTYGGQRGTDN